MLERKGPMPPIELDEIPDIKSMSREELDKIPFEKWKLYCGVEGCNHYTGVRDYGLWPELLGRFVNCDWINVYKSHFLCGKHWKELKTNPNLPRKLEFNCDTIARTIFKT
jgi:hypothetical protein